MIPPVQIVAWSKGYERKGVVPGLRSVSVVFRDNKAGDAEFTVRADHPRVGDLTADGARAVLTYTPTGGTPEVLSGAVQEISGEGRASRSTRTFKLVDDFDDILMQTIGWPNPTGTVLQQGDDGAYYTVTGPAETVLKDIVAANTTRTGKPLVVPTSTGLGDTVTVSIRMHPLFDRLFPAVDGLRVRVVQVGDERHLLVSERATYPRTLTEGSGVLTTNSFAIVRPTVTRVTVGAGGEGEARAFRQYVDAARESAFGLVREVFQDARDIPAADPDLAALLQARADETLAEGAPTVSLSVDLTETERFRFGVSFTTGDVVSMQLLGLPFTVTERIREVEVSWAPDQGRKVTPRVGAVEQSADAAMAADVVSLARAVRDLRSR